MNQKIAVSTLTILSLLLMSTVLNVNSVSAQSSGYTIQSVEHAIEVMFSGHIVVRDEIKVSGSVANGFQIGIPSKYAGSILKVVAFDSKNAYTVETVSQLGGQSGFYVAQVDFKGQNPSSFTVEFLLSNNLISQYTAGYYQLDFPAYPSLTTTASQCKVTLSLPTDPSSIVISKSDGEVNSTSYSKSNLAAFTSTPAVASFDITIGLLQLVDINTLNRQVTILPSGEITCTDSYTIKNMDKSAITFFLLNLPSDAKNVVVREGSGSVLSTETFDVGNILLVNASLVSAISTGQLIQLNAQYNLPSVVGNSFNFTIFPAINYLVEKATFTLVLPEGASATSSDSSAVITANGFEQKLTLTRQDVTYVDYQLPGYDFLQVTLNYNQVWASYKPTIIVFALSSVCCITVVFYKKRKTKETISTTKTKTATTRAAQTKTGTVKAVPVKTVQATPEFTSKFLDVYEERRELFNELKALDLKVHKGRIPRSQYKNQKHAIDGRIEALTHSINKSKEVFRQSSPELADLARQLELAEVDLAQAENRLSYLETRRNSGQITLEEYKETIGSLQEAKESVDVEIDGILLRLREKMQ
jgi:hypothetical protein